MIAKVIEQLDSGVYLKLKEDLIASRGEKMLQLMELYRSGADEDAISPKKLALTNPAFYTLKSRLQDKVQKALFESASDDYADILKNLAAIPFLVNNTPKESAVMLLLFLEKELKRKDQPGELAHVYGALKKLHSFHKDYFHYEQLYNKNIAYYLAYEKAEEVLTHFTRECGYYLMSLDVQHQEVLRLYLKELNNLSRVYDSHRIKVCKYIADLSYALFVDPKKEIPGSDATVQEVLADLESIIHENADDQKYRFVHDIWHFLNYEYYWSLGLYKNAKPSYEAVAANQQRVLHRGHTAIASRMLLSAFDLYNSSADIEKVIQLLPEADTDDQYSKVNYALFKASIAFHKGNYSEAASTLNDLLNAYSLKNYFVAEYNVKLFLVLCLLCAEKSDLAEVQFRSITRKIAAVENKSVLQAGVTEWIQLAKICLNASENKRKEKLKSAIEDLNRSREKPGSLLFHLRIPETIIGVL